ncbi:hypothetical protein B0H14DRAFT_3444528 [Mycena olivaceomarginata]|nr:hypothetical protein B0H14DRAFT_3444528 [Mycena olivaceomarginata]
MRTGAPRPDLFPPASTSSISKGLPLSSLATTLPPRPESTHTHEPSQASISLKRPPPSPLASKCAKVTRTGRAHTPHHTVRRTSKA